MRAKWMPRDLDRWIARGEHPRPQMQRESWRSLDGTWDFAFDDDARWSQPHDVRFDRTIRVPYPPESDASGIGDQRFHHVCWYRTSIALTPIERRGRVLVHFGSVDYRSTVWANGQLVCEHSGGHTPFSADITHVVRDGERVELVLRAADDPFDLAQPRGKQDWLEDPHEIWYPRTTGIWQTVWIETVPTTSIRNLVWTPYLDQWEMGIGVELEGPVEPGTTVRVRLAHAGQILADDRYLANGREIVRRIAFSDPGIDDYRNHLLWSPLHPLLIDAVVELWQGDRCVDAVWSYTALRSVGVQGNRFMLNGRPFFLKMVLDQGYWPDTLMSPPNATALRQDVEATIALGFNGVRKHQKLEDPRWLFFCDLYGLLVWEEMPSPYRFTGNAVQRLIAEWTEAIRRDVSHPCICAWVPLNESWGVPDLTTNPAHRDYVRALYHLTKTLDPTRPAVGNDGWEHVATDFVTIHDYASNPAVLRERYATPESVELVLQRQEPGGRAITLAGHSPQEHPVILSEFGGIALIRDDSEHGWGYSRVRDPEQLASAYEGMLRALHACRGLAGFCYTQLTDTFQERNGLLTATRRPKVEVARIAAATRGNRKAFAMDVDPEI
ncbi:MAG TPA: glycoside hydrolase family 2 TIM barrel-domain containing protein [Kofleriaceae bacterium]|nr:glycoside hydrolase family 2 TIM barrel-domain containing protein [Kofleriaceae bacterium]